MENLEIREYENSVVVVKDDIYYYFPMYFDSDYINIQSPIDGKFIQVPRKESETIVNVIENYIKHKKREPLHYWDMYLDAKRYYGNISYKCFISNYLTDYMNMGYSETLD